MNLKGSGIGKSLPPRGIQMFKGYKNVALTRLTYSDASGLNRKPVFQFFKSEKSSISFHSGPEYLKTSRKKKTREIK